jgi:hypothetical protein
VSNTLKTHFDIAFDLPDFKNHYPVPVPDFLYSLNTQHLKRQPQQKSYGEVRVPVKHKCVATSGILNGFVYVQARFSFWLVAFVISRSLKHSETLITFSILLSKVKLPD